MRITLLLPCLITLIYAGTPAAQAIPFHDCDTQPGGVHADTHDGGTTCTNFDDEGNTTNEPCASGCNGAGCPGGQWDTYIDCEDGVGEFFGWNFCDASGQIYCSGKGYRTYHIMCNAAPGNSTAAGDKNGASCTNDMSQIVCDCALSDSEWSANCT